MATYTKHPDGFEEGCTNLTSILNLRHLKPLSVDETEHDYHVRAESTLETRKCQHCQSDSIIGFGRYEILIRDLPVHGKRVGIYLNRRRYKCRSCTKTFGEAIPEINDKREMTSRLVDWIGKQAIKRPFAHVAEETGVVINTVRAIFSDYVNDLEKQVRFETPQWMGIDEIHIIRKPRCVIGNIQSNTIVEMLSDRNKPTVATYLEKLQGKDKVRYVAMDMWRPYRDACQAVLPQAQIVVDKFHVLRMANVAMETIRKSHRASLAPAQRRTLMHDRFVLLKRPKDLNDKESLLLSGWTENFPALEGAYRAKEAFFRLYDCQTKAEAKRYYEAWANSLPDDLAPAFQPITTAFKTWEPLILNYFDHRITNAFSESMNNLIRLMNRLGRGYSFEALRAKVLFTDKLHKHKRPAFQRRDVPDGAMRDMMSKTVALSQTTSDTDRPINLGVDITTLTALLESGDL